MEEGEERRGNQSNQLFVIKHFQDILSHQQETQHLEPQVSPGWLVACKYSQGGKFPKIIWEKYLGFPKLCIFLFPITLLWFSVCVTWPHVRLSGAQPGDQGEYECQVSTETKLSSIKHLQVIQPQVDTISLHSNTRHVISVISYFYSCR